MSFVLLIIIISTNEGVQNSEHRIAMLDQAQCEYWASWINREAPFQKIAICGIEPKEPMP